MFHFFKTIQNGTFTIPEVFILTTIPARSSFVLVGTAIKKHFSRRCDFRKIYAMHFSVFENSVSHDERTKKKQTTKNYNFIEHNSRQRFTMFQSTFKQK